MVVWSVLDIMRTKQKKEAQSPEQDVPYSDAHHIEFQCASCGRSIVFSVLEMAKGRLTCPHCAKGYMFNEQLVDKIRRFENLLGAVREAKDLLGSANVGISLGGEEVKVPYRLLLTRLTSTLTLDVGGKQTHFRFRIEPLNFTELGKT